MNETNALQPVVLEEVVGERFGRYSKYIIQDRAIPDVRDGLKPVQRRILYAMYEAGNTPDKPYRKSAKTVGDVMGNYHPHGDTSIYDGMVRLAQPWKMAHPLVDGHGNWGSQDDDPAAAMRYTEARLSLLAMEMLKDIEKETVPHRDNFDGSMQEPIVLPAHYPNLLVNGASGISAGFATEIPTHNIHEIIEACIRLLDDPQLTVTQLMDIVQGPDFPTGGIILGKEGIVEAYKTGKGRITIRSRTHMEDMRGGRQQIVITEIPYGIVKAKLVASMEHIRLDKKIEGIAEVRDESGRNGLRIVIELKKEADSQSILHYLLKKTDLQTAYNFNMVAIVNKAPQQLGIKAMLTAYLDHQKEVVLRRTQYDLRKAQDREHILLGFEIAWANLDAIIALIRQANDRTEATQALMHTFSLSERQTEAILVMPLYRLTRLEIDHIVQQLADIRQQIAALQRIIQEERVLIDTIKTALRHVRKRFAIARRTDITEETEALHVAVEAMIASEDVWVTLSAQRYMKRSSILSYQRSGADVRTAGCREGDAIFFARCLNTLEQLLLFSQSGFYATLPIHAIPDAKWKDEGIPLTNVVPFAPTDRVVAALPVAHERTLRQGVVVMASKKGAIKCTDIGEYGAQRLAPIVAAKWSAEDEVIGVFHAQSVDIPFVLVTKKGYFLKLLVRDIPLKGRVATGTKLMKLEPDDEVVAVVPLHDMTVSLLFVTALGYVMRLSLTHYPVLRHAAGVFLAPPVGKESPGCYEVVTAVAVHGDSALRFVPEQGEPHDVVASTIPESTLENIAKTSKRSAKEGEKNTPAKRTWTALGCTSRIRFVVKIF